jgi:hypothetical protein
LESVSGVEAERDSVIAVVPETWRVPLDPLSEFSIAGKEPGRIRRMSSTWV